MDFAGESISFDGCTPLGPSDKSVQSQISDSELMNLLQHPSNDPLAGLTHEPQGFPLSEINQSTGKATTEDSPSQRFPNFITYSSYPTDVDSANNLSGPRSMFGPTKKCPSSVSILPSSSKHWPCHSASPSGGGNSSDGTRNGKVEISPASLYRCRDCRVTFTKASYKVHISRRHCTAPTKTRQCDVCQQNFTLLKDLKRHQRRCCPTLEANSEQLEQFACDFCTRSYTRKDSLQHHIRAKHSDGQ